MVGSDKGYDRSRRPGAEDRAWSHRSGTSGQTIRSSSDAVCSLHCARGDE
jgi:hypothetical protein